MGLFLAMSCVVEGQLAEAADVMRSYVQEKGGIFNPDGHGLPEEEQARFIESEGGVTVFYPNKFFDWDEASAFLSTALKKPVFSFHLHDGDLWMFLFFVDGQCVAQFNTLPGYWGEITPEEQAAWLPTTSDIAVHVPGLDPKRIAPYLVHWNLDDETPGKVNPDDEFEYNESWQLLDFMRQLGFAYPDPGEGAGYRFNVARG